MVKGLEDGWFQKRIAESAARQQWEIEQHRKLVVGVNEFVTDEPELSIPILKIGEEADREQRQRMAQMRATRDNALVASRLGALREAARGTENVVPYILDCARAYCTLYEIRAALEDVFGAYRETGVLLSAPRAASARTVSARATPWWQTHFDAQYLHEYEPLFDLVQDRREVARLLDIMELPSGARVLDCPCGQGRHAHLLAEAGFDVDGLDYSDALLDVARARGTSRTLPISSG